MLKASVHRINAWRVSDVLQPIVKTLADTSGREAMRWLCVVVAGWVLLSGCTVRESASTRELRGLPAVIDNSQEPMNFDYEDDDAAGLSSVYLRRLGIPSKCVGTNRAGVYKVASLTAVDVDSKVLTYEVRYAETGKRSTARLSLDTGSILEEVFPEEWRVEYEYDRRNLELPRAFAVFRYSPGTKSYDRLIARYTREEMQWGVLRFRRDDGTTLSRRTAEFRMMP